MKKIRATPSETPFVRQDYVEIDGFTISRGDIIKIQGEHGSKFKFSSFVTNTVSGAQWVDCFELMNGMPSVFRSFSLNRVRRIPIRHKRGKRVNRGPANSAS